MFKKNQSVYVRRLRAHGYIMAVHRVGGYKVAVGSLTFECTEADLESVKKGGERKAPGVSRKKRVERGTAVRSGSRTDKIDLHGFTVEEAISAVTYKVDRALFEDRIERLEIVHGVGTGKLRSAIHKYLASLGVVEFKADSVNPGVTWVYFD